MPTRSPCKPPAQVAQPLHVFGSRGKQFAYRGKQEQGNLPSYNRFYRSQAVAASSMHRLWTRREQPIMAKQQV